MDNEKKKYGAWWVWVVFLAIATGIVLTGLSFAGVIGQTAVERVVFEQSYQYTAARRAEIATYEAQIDLLQAQRRTADEKTVAEIDAQLAAIGIRLAVAQGGAK